MIPGSANPLLLKSAAAAGGYQIERSLRFSSNDSAYFSRIVSTAGDRKKWTWSGWAKRSKLGATGGLFGSVISSGLGGSWAEFIFNSVDGLGFQSFASGGYNWYWRTNAVFRDTSAWYHVMIVCDQTETSVSNAIKFYVNGVLATHAETPSTWVTNQSLQVNAANTHNIGKFDWTAEYFSGYLDDIHFIDGQALTPSSFTEVSATTGQLIPKAYTGTFTGNSFWLKFSDNSSTTSGSNVGIGKDFSGLGNYWNSTNLSVTAGAGNDSLVDTPTSYGTDTGVGGEVRGNYATFNPTESSTSGTKTLTNGNLDVLLADANAARLTIPPIQGSGKYQWEITIGSKTATYYQMGLNLLSMVYATGDLHATFRSDGNLSNTLSGSWSGTGVSYTSGDVITVTYDNATNACAFYKNGVYSATFTVSGTPQASLNFGVFYGGSGNTNYTLNAGQRPFAYPVSGFKALCDTNLPAPVVAKSSDYFQTVLYTGNGSTQTVSGLSFSPDFVWLKMRSASDRNILTDIVRGVTNTLNSDSTRDEATATEPNQVTAYTSSGFTVGSNSNVNGTGSSFVAWAWDAGTTTTTNTQGSITSSVRANASAGFSIVSYTSTGGTATVGHGLGIAPSMVITKGRNVVSAFITQHVSLAANNVLYLNGTDASQDVSGNGSLPKPTSTVFSVNNQTGSNGGTYNMIAYCFAPVAGYSSMGSFTPTGTADSSFVYCGFRPRFIMVKQTSASSNWITWDTARDSYNYASKELYPNLSDAEVTNSSTYSLDILSNGFKMRNPGMGGGSTWIYCAWAESPFQYARAR